MLCCWSGKKLPINRTIGGRGAAVQTLGVGGTPAQNRPCRRSSGRFRGDKPRTRGSEAQTVQHHGETEAGGLAKLAVEQNNKTDAEKQQGQNFGAQHRPKRKPAEIGDQGRAPHEKQKTKHRAALQQDARPLVLREQKGDAADESARADIRANAEPVTSERNAIDDLQSLGESAQGAPETTTASNTLMPAETSSQLR